MDTMGNGQSFDTVPVAITKLSYRNKSYLAK